MSSELSSMIAPSSAHLTRKLTVGFRRLFDGAVKLYRMTSGTKANAKVESKKSAYYAGIRKELLEKTDAMYQKLSELIKATAK